MSGHFVSFEGVEGVGKSTVIRHITHWLKEQGVHVVKTREPGGTPLANKMRKLLLENTHEKLTIPAEVMLMFASRSQHVENLIKPEIARGSWVISDRYVDSSYAYQSGGRGVPYEYIELLDKWICADVQPERVILLDLPVAVSRSRIRNRAPDRIEKEKCAFFEQVREVFMTRAAQYPDRFRVVSADQPLSSVVDNVKKILLELLSSV